MKILKFSKFVKIVKNIYKFFYEHFCELYIVSIVDYVKKN